MADQESIPLREKDPRLEEGQTLVNGVPQKTVDPNGKKTEKVAFYCKVASNNLHMNYVVIIWWLRQSVFWGFGWFFMIFFSEGV